MNWGNTYVFAWGCQAKLVVALQTLEERTGNDETLAEAESRRRVNEEVRAKADSEAVQPAREIVSRGPGKRRATALA